MPRSLNVQTLVDPRHFADLVRELKRNGVPHRSSYSHVVHLLLDGTRDAWGAAHYQDAEEALRFLASEGFSVTQIKQASRGPRLLAHLRKEALQPSEGPAVDLQRAAEIEALLDGSAQSETDTEEA